MKYLHMEHLISIFKFLFQFQFPLVWSRLLSYICLLIHFLIWSWCPLLFPGPIPSHLGVTLFCVHSTALDASCLMQKSRGIRPIFLHGGCLPHICYSSNSKSLYAFELGLTCAGLFSPPHSSICDFRLHNACVQPFYYGWGGGAELIPAHFLVQLTVFLLILSYNQCVF